MNTKTSGATGAQLAHDRIDRYRSLGVFGKPAYQSHVQLRAMLKAKRGDKVANYFARPTHDPDFGELRWTSEVSGPARAWHEMSGEEQAERALDLEVVRSGLMSFSRELRAQSAGQPGGAASFASLLDQATRVPADGDFLYFVGDQPVIAFWGFEDEGGSSVDPLAVAPTSTPKPFTTPTPVVVPVPEEPIKQKPVPVVVAARRPGWHWLLLAFLALLLLGLLLFGLRACRGEVPFDPAVVAPDARKPDGASPPNTGTPGQSPVESMAPPGPGGAISPPPGGRSDTVPSIVPPGATGAPPDAAPGAPGAPGMKPEGSSNLPEPPDVTGATSPPDASNAPKLPDAKEPSRDGAPNDRMPPLPDVKPGADRPPPSPDAGKPMSLPSQPNAAKKLDFLEGEWKAGEGLVDRETKQPLDLSFKFGKEGGGEVTLHRPDGTSCRGAVQGRMDSGKLAIQGNQAVPCSDGGRYGAPKIECAKDNGGKTQCFGINPDGSRYFMGMQRQ